MTQLKTLDATIVHMEVFGSVNASAAGNEAMRRVFGRIDWPVTWIEGAACDGRLISGLQVSALVGCQCSRIELDGRIIGSVFETKQERHCMIGGLVPAQLSLPRGEQTKLALEDLQRALGKAGFGLEDTVRTWFFLDDILGWYEEFNRARTEIYRGVKFLSGAAPASTGVGARNCFGSALALSAWAWQSRQSPIGVAEVASPLQCPAPAYGSSFSRAMEVRAAQGRRLFISGTAGILPDGQTAWPGDVRKQVSLTMEVVEAILNARGFGFCDVTRAIAYFKNAQDIGAFEAWRQARELNSLPVVTTQCNICRDDLLFELEADAWETG